jgi:uncharacterized protein (TIGR02145 family)
MKKLLFLIALSFSLTANAQKYFISFAGTGLSTTVSTVNVENLNKGTNLSLNGGDILSLTIATGVNSIEDNQSSELKIYPNPMTANATLEIFPPVAGDAVITVCEITGKLVVQIQSYLENLRQSFSLSGIKNGFYLINIKGTSYQFSGKLLSNGGSNGTIKIVKVNNINQAIDEKAIETDNKGTLVTVDMEYTTGDKLKFTAVSGNYSTIKTDIPTSTKTITFNFVACSDGDNNFYPVLETVNQVWMAENLKTTKYSDGTDIPLVIDNTAWTNLSTSGYCWYNNDNATYKNLYGALYNWYAINTNKLCPTGWHVPTETDWTTLETLLGGRAVAGGKLKEEGLTHWSSPNTGADNSSGFTGLPGGYRFRTGAFSSVGLYCALWSATEYDATFAWYRYLYHTGNDMIRITNYKPSGYSVRCVKD